MRIAREAGFGLVPLTRGRVLAVGGLDDYGALRYAETYDVRIGRWRRIADMTVPRYAAAVVVLRSGQVLVAGGANGLRAQRSAELLTRPA